MMSNPQIEELAVQYQRAMNSVDFCVEKFKTLGINPDQYLHQRESYMVKKNKSNSVRNRDNMRKRLAALKLKYANSSNTTICNPDDESDTMVDEDCAGKQERAHSTPQFENIEE